MAEQIIPLVMCGGAGTRLWPASREGWPKQFLRLFGPHSTFQETMRRVSDPTLYARPIIITHHQYRFQVAEQLGEINLEADVLLEPLRRDSAPAIAAGSAFARARDDDAIVLALAADHVVRDVEAFTEACKLARVTAEKGMLVTFGIRPDRPATEYGYIRPGAPLGSGAQAVDQFVEKPDLATATQYVAEGYLWNSGNFLFQAKTLLDEYGRVEPQSAAAVAAALDRAATDLGFVRLDADAFAGAAAKSIDHAVMEKTKRAAVVPVSYSWSDVGSWQAVWDLSQKDGERNSAHGKALFLDTRGSYVASDKALVALFGVEDLVVVASADAILVARRQDGDGMKRLVQKLKEVEPAVTEDHLRVHRPWGSYQSLETGNRYQVKRIVVKAGGRLSLQMHHHRSEHWVVVRGTARVQVADKVEIVHENQSVYIPIGARHRLENPGKIDLELIEVQTGSYLGEDDIERLEDDYRRS